MTAKRAGGDTGTSTAPDPQPISRLKRARTLRRVALGVLFVFLALSLAGAFGVRTRTVSASFGGYTLEQEYATITRPGLATPWALTVRKPGGFDGPVTVGVSASYFDIFDENGIDPEPSSSTTGPNGLLLWEFEPPDGDSLEISFDARLEPARQSGARGRSVVFEDDRAVVSVSYVTRVAP
ncbi:MAG TPA: hypothetical protein VNE62_02230 [Actinomycetota bacterium]|nr:hypothetical protein [Actinomycetota bacterium]